MTVGQPVTEPPLPPEDAAPAEGRRRPSTLGGICYLAVLTITVTGIGIVSTGEWRLGVRWIAGALIIAAISRLVLPAREAGMLAVRHRVFDCVLLAVVGVLLVFLAGTIPNQPV